MSSLHVQWGVDDYILCLMKSSSHTQQCNYADLQWTSHKWSVAGPQTIDPDLIRFGPKESTDKTRITIVHNKVQSKIMDNPTSFLVFLT